MKKKSVYNPKTIESKWQRFWQNKKTFEAKNKGKKKMILIEFPYPSGYGLHMGHMRPFIAGDVVAKYFKLRGFDTMYPVGWDAFGLPAENYAIKNKVHPSTAIEENIKNAKKQLLSWGTGFDWSREVNTTDPEYYKWTQKLFLEFYKSGLAYEKFGEINWCPKDKTGLANEEVVDGKCERCGTVVEKKSLRQWYLKITEYAEKLLDGLKDLPEWPEAVKTQQANWIGKSEGSEIEFKLTNSEIDSLNISVKVFTTRADTLFGVTYLVLAPENNLVEELKPQIKNWDEVEEYIKSVKNKPDIDRTAENKEKSGVELKGIFAINPANNEKVPVWIADYVLASYGTGAVMAVPQHDDRDRQFSLKYSLPIIDRPFIDIDEVMQKYGKKVVKYKLRDWVFSRQRYWGEPIPLVHCDKCGIVPVPEKELPVRLPDVKNYEPTGTGESPLAVIDKWVNVKCPKCIEDSKKTKYLIFDFDGVIGDTIDATLKNYLALGIAKNDTEARAKIHEWFMREPHHMSKAEFTSEELKKRIISIKEFGNSLSQFKYSLFKDFVFELKKFKNVKMAVVSAGSAIYVKSAIKSSGLKMSHVYTGEDSVKKGDSVNKICKAWKIDPSEAYYFTDAISDYYELEHFIDPKKIIGCAWGFLGEEKLKEKFPISQILNKPKDIHKLFEICDAKRETNTMPQWAGSSWYWLRYMDPKNKKEFSSLKMQKYWSPVDLYFGGMEHTTLHLLYSRFWNLFLYDKKLVSVKEPYKKRVPHGMILGPDGEKMSKSIGNVVNPDEVIQIYGADTTRLYMMFLGPHGAQVSWNDKGVVGTRRFVERVFHMKDFVGKEESKEVTTALHKAIKKVTFDIESFSFNTAVSAMMIFTNTVYDAQKISKKSFSEFLKLLSPFTPHLSEELWSDIGNKKSIYLEKWPVFDEKLIKSDKVTIAIQVNGKVRSEITIDVDISDEEVKALAISDKKISDLIEGKEIKKVIVIKNRIVNLVIA